MKHNWIGRIGYVCVCALAWAAGTNPLASPPPRIDSLTPDHGPTSGGTVVQVAGENFGTTTGTITLGGLAVTPISWSPNQLAFALPVGSGASRPVIVTVAGRSSNTKTFSYDPPRIDSLTPSHASTQGGILIQVYGENFGAASGTITFGGTPAPLTFQSHRQLAFVLPSGGGADRPVVATVGGQSSNSKSFSYDSPRIVSLTPDRGPSTGGTIVDVVGESFGVTPGTVSVGEKAGSIVSQGHRQIRFSTPAGQRGARSVVITSAGQASAPATFLYDPPTIQSTVPAHGPKSGGTKVTLTGINFGTTGTVTVGGLPGVVESWAPTTILFRIPAGQGLDQPLVVVADDLASLPARFSYDQPLITSLTPTHGPTRGNTTVVLEGIGFGNSGNVFVGTTEATVENWTDTMLTFRTPAGRGLRQPVVVQARVGGQKSDPFPFDYDPPRIDSLTPDHAPTTGGAMIEILGANFGAIPGTVAVGGVAASPAAWGETRLQFICPVGTGANLPVVVTVAGQDSDPARFSYDRPRIASLNPDRGPAAGGTSVDLAGENFGTVAGTITVGGLTAVPTLWSQRLIRFTTPAGNRGNHSVVITVRGQASDPVLFVFDPPTILTTTPLHGPQSGGTRVTLTGNNFGAVGTVTVGGAPGIVESWSNTTIQFRVPPGRGVDQPLVVTVGDAASLPARFGYDQPEITAMTPSHGPTPGNTTVVLQGTGFGNSGSVIMGGMEAPLELWSDTLIRFRSTAGRGIQQPVVVLARLAGQRSDPFPFDYDPPRIDALTPNHAPTLGSSLLEIQGANFGAATGTITVDGLSVSPTLWSHTRIQFLTRPGVGIHLPVIVTVAGQSSDALPFSYDPPLILALTPDHGLPAGGTSVDVAGENFGAVMGKLTVGGVEVAPSVWGQRLVRFRTPPGPRGPQDVVVTAGGQASRPKVFSFEVPILITGLNPSHGPTLGDTPVVLNGTGFGSRGTLTVGGTAAPVDLWTDTQVRFRTPPGHGRQRPVLLRSEGQTSQPVAFDYDPPVLAAVTPNHGPTAGGTLAQITGLNFGSSGRLVFGGVDLTPVRWTDGAIDFHTPVGQGTQTRVQVIVDQQASATVGFAYDAPRINSVSPVQGPLTGGTRIELTGSSLGSHGSVTVGPWPATVENWDHGSVVVRSPPSTGAGAFPIVVNVSGQLAKAGDFTYGFHTRSNNTPIVIHDATSATPYPSTIDVSGVPNVVKRVAVTLRGLSHGRPEDIEALLTTPSGQRLVLLSGTGGKLPVLDADVTFSPLAAKPIPEPGPIVAGTFLPSQNGILIPFPAPAPAAPYATRLEDLAGSTANGAWSLYLFDAQFEVTGEIARGWELYLESDLPEKRLTAPVVSRDHGWPSLARSLGPNLRPVSSRSIRKPRRLAARTGTRPGRRPPRPAGDRGDRHRHPLLPSARPAGFHERQPIESARLGRTHGDATGPLPQRALTVPRPHPRTPKLRRARRIPRRR